MTTQPISIRFSQHVSLSKSKNSKMAICRAIEKYGRNNFTISPLYKAETMGELMDKESEYIILYETMAPNGYNLKKGGEIGGNGGANLGLKWSDKAKQRHCRAMKDRDLIPWNKGTKNTTTANKTSFKKGYSLGCDNYFYGKKHSEKSRKKISKANKNRFSTVEGRIKHSIARGGKDFEVYKIVESIGTKKSFKMIKDEYIGNWISQAECARDLGVSRSSINLCLNNRSKYSKNYLFRYKKEI